MTLEAARSMERIISPKSRRLSNWHTPSISKRSQRLLGHMLSKLPLNVSMKLRSKEEEIFHDPNCRLWKGLSINQKLYKYDNVHLENDGYTGQ